jgi:hypothetical protein
MYLEGADASNFGSDSQSGAILPWAMARANFHVSGLARATAATSGTPAGDRRLWARNMANGLAALASLINGQLYTGNGSAPNLVGLAQAIGSVTNHYAGIDRTTDTIWQPNLFNASGPSVALTFDQIRSDLAAIYIACGMRPDLAMVHPNVFRKLTGLFDPQKFYVMQTMDVSTARGKVSLEGGVAGVKFDECTFVEDKDCTDSTIQYLNTDHVRIEYLPDEDMEIPGLEDETMVMQADDGFGQTPMGARLEMLSKSGDADKCECKTYLQLVVDRPNACGVRSNIA